MYKFIVIVFFAFCFSNAEIVEGKSGIPAIDTLENHEWDVKTSNKSLVLALCLGVFPGGMQYYFQHPVRGGFITAINLGLWFDIAISKKTIQQKRIEDASKYQDSVAYYTKLLLETPRNNNFTTWQLKRQNHLYNIRSINDSKIENEDLRKVETAWAIGLHLYAYMDGFGIWIHNKRRTNKEQSITGAILRSAFVPGLGQIYNDEWGKAGLFYMAYLGAAVSVVSRQNVVEYYQERNKIAIIEDDSYQEEYTNDKLIVYRKKRNQFIWGTILIYLYSLADAAVDASLADFDNPLYITFKKDFSPSLGLAFNF